MPGDAEVGSAGPERSAAQRIPVGLSTVSTFPSTVADAFHAAAELGYDGVEVMVHTEPVSRRADALRELIRGSGLPVLSVHAPCLLVTARVWGTDPLVKLARSIDLAEQIGAPVVVTHPPFAWQRSAARDFPAAVAELATRTDVVIAVENMFPVAVGGLVVNTYRPHWDPVPAGYRHFTLDLSHTAAAGTDALDLAERMGDGLAHLHLADGSGSRRDEHLIPGRGGQPCADVLRRLGRTGYSGAVIVEVSTRGRSAEQRHFDLAEALAFARWHLDEPPGPATDR